MGAEIRLNEDGSLDEVVADDVAFFHLEQMSDGHWWLSVDLDDGSQIHVDIYSRSGRAAVDARAERHAAPGKT